MTGTAAPTQPALPPPHRPRPRKPWGGVDVVVGIATFLVASVVYGVIALAIDIAAASPPGTDPTTLLDGYTPSPVGLIVATGLASFTAFFCVPWLASRRKGQRSMREDFGLAITWFDVPRGIGVGAVAMGVSATFSLLWEIVASSPAPTNTQILDTSTSLLGGVLIVGIVGIVVPIAEEVFFRGLLLRSLRRRYSVALSVVVSSAIFGVLHAASASSPAGVVLVPLITGTMGAVFALTALKTGRLGSAIVAHITVNTVAATAILLGLT